MFSLTDQVLFIIFPVHQANAPKYIRFIIFLYRETLVDTDNIIDVWKKSDLKNFT